MTDLHTQATQLQSQVRNASPAERLRLQPLVDRVVTAMALQGYQVPRSLRTMNNMLKDEALDDMFDNMPV
ncbi:MAG: hypothetical protein AAF665_06600 [Pseudomonadota bacterium]